MRRFFTLVCLLCLAVPAGISISGCTRNPDANYCNGLGYGLKITDVAVITLQPQTFGISLAYGQTQQSQVPTAKTCQGNSATVSSYVYGTTNNQLLDISPTGNMCAGTWNRNTGGGIANYTICSFPDPPPSTGGLPYGIAYITVSANSVSSNPVEVFVHTQVTSVSLVTEPATGTAQQCFSQNTVATLDAQACFVGNGNTQNELCAPPSVTSANFVCSPPTHIVSGNVVPITPDIIASGTFTSVPPTSYMVAANYDSGGTITGTVGQTCTLSDFNNGSSGATATVTLTGTNTIASGTPMLLTNAGTGATAPPTTATLSSGTATCSGTATITSWLGPIAGTTGQTCTLSNFNNNSTGATATVALTSANTIASGTALTIVTGGLNATAPPIIATLSNGTATCSGTATVATTMTPVPDCSTSIGNLNYSIGTPSIASLNTETNQITAELPGTTAITASIAGGSSSAGYFSTCPPKSISVTLANGKTTGTITQGVTQNLTTNILDTNGNTITGLALDYQSTDPIDISTANGGGVTTSFPGVASVYAICQPTTCNPAPINLFGLYGTGLSISSNPVNITVPGTASDYLWFSAPGQSQYVIPVELLSGSVGSTVRLPYVPNSVQMDRLGNNLYFGSIHELMIYSTASNAVTRQDTSAPGVVLAVAPNNSQLLINDQVRQVFYLYTSTGGVFAAFGGVGNAAAWSPDAKTLYVTDSAALNNTPENIAAGITGHSDTLYVYNVDSGWSTYPLAASGPATPNPAGAQNLAITIPGVGAFLSGYPTVAHTWCPTGTVGNAASILFYPQGPSPDNSVDAATDVLAATTDGNHILGASLSGTNISLSDIGVTIPYFNCQPETIGDPAEPNPNYSLALDDTFTPLALTTTFTPPPLAFTANAAAVNQVVAAPSSNLAFITYSPPAIGATTGASLPYYVPGSGVVSSVTLTGNSAITAPLTGAFSPDSSYFFVSTSGDNMIHYISVPTLTDTEQISPNLPACTPVSEGGNDLGCIYTGTGTIVPATAIEVKPRATT
ncbi:MAG: hypothetical protein ABSA48_12035 [Terracidiphilus sp.]|jgi:sugar lactone lactonase YvrE